MEAFLASVRAAVAAFYAQPPRKAASNLGQQHHRALAALRSNQQVVIKPADKNLGLVILDRRWYVAECRRQLADTATYQQVPASDVPLLVPGLQQRLAATVWRHALALPGQVQRFLTATAHTHTRLPSFYLLPKIHKLPQVTPQHLPLLRGRPIVAAHSWITTPTSQWLAQVLNAACAQAHPHVLPDSRALIVQLESTHVASGSILVTFDVESMYPSIDTSNAIPA